MLLRETEDFFNFGIHSTATVTSEMYFLSRITIKTNNTLEIMVHTTKFSSQTSLQTIKFSLITTFNLYWF